MRALVTGMQMFIDRRGQVWSPISTWGYSGWTRYLDVYQEVELLVRVVPIDEPPEGASPVAGPGVSTVPLPSFHGPRDIGLVGRVVRPQVRAALARAEAVHLRTPCPLATTVWLMLPRGRPYGIEVQGDPDDVFSPGAFLSRLRPLYRYAMGAALRRQCSAAVATAYVTASRLQSRYPPAPGSFTTHFSSIELEKERIVDRPRDRGSAENANRVVFVGALEQPYKGLHILLDAVARCAHSGTDVRLTIVGGGRLQQQLEQQAAALGISARVRFTGHLFNADEVERELDHADLFVLPSLTEGLPKALIEAMARALPCIASSVGGNTELLPDEDLVPQRDVGALARGITDVLRDPGRRARMSARNLATAEDYRIEILRKRRQAFYHHVRDLTAQWLLSRESVQR